eukprot:TRINITY_DN3548_c0_g1_i2.p1 TRINITY_DN3548_c0_g1~~TRINITY_DN3548_c0_g1_i2.p1  ORF type:complete len:787 (+),score=179.18 TRINITY_DN3548_c0_g1_i2:62-2422(+)
MNLPTLSKKEAQDFESFLDRIQQLESEVKTIRDGLSKVNVEPFKGAESDSNHSLATSLEVQSSKGDKQIDIAGSSTLKTTAEIPSVPKRTVSQQATYRSEESATNPVTFYAQDRKSQSKDRAKQTVENSTGLSESLARHADFAKLKQKESTATAKSCVPKDYKYWDSLKVDDDSDEENAKLTQLKETDAFMKEMEADAEERLARRRERINLADREKNQGNVAYKLGQFEKAIEHYTEAIRLYGDNTILYTNRAQAYLKLRRFQEALNDCDQSLQIDQKFVKAFIKKSQIYMEMEDFVKAEEEACKAATHDADSELVQNQFKELSARKKKAELEAKNQEVLDLMNSTGHEEIKKRYVQLDQQISVLKNPNADDTAKSDAIFKLRTTLLNASWHIPVLFRLRNGFPVLFSHIALQPAAVLTCIALACADEYNPLVVIKNYVPIVLGQVKEDDMVVTMAALAVVEALVSYDEAAQPLIDSDIFVIIKSLLQSQNVQYHFSICNIIQLWAPREIFRKEFALDQSHMASLVHLINANYRPMMVEQASQTIAALTSYRDLHQAFLKTDAHRCFVSILLDRKPHSALTIHHICLSLFNLSIDTSFCTKFQDMDVTTVCLDVMLENKIETAAMIAGFLSRVHNSVTITPDVLRRFTTVVISLMPKSTSTKQRSNFVRCLVHCSRAGDISADMLSLGLPALEPIFKSQTRDEVGMGNAALCIAECARWADFKIGIPKAWIAILINTMKDCSGASQKNAAIALARLASNRNNLAVIRELRGTEMMLRLVPEMKGLN